MSGAQESPCRILVMASGFGSNFQALIDAVAAGRIRNSHIVRLVTNRRGARATARADDAGEIQPPPCIPWDYFNLISHGFLTKGDKDEGRVAEARRRYDAALAERVLAAEPRPELVVLAGWMHVFSGAFLRPVRDAGVKLINLHPALRGEFDGANAVERAFEALKAGQITRTGIMVHEVVEEVDRGPLVMDEEIEWRGEDLDALKERIHAREHELIVKATAKVVDEILEKREQ
ncbi:Formyl transferase [Metarhizium album ARSEF 1941]|uniref:phosphoribosylglycinamide formyltransferase 1 n=1 Tax=Metarhizium album (strain ARSEF 1941) TaxID=1081103 RepID=A0A0B2WNQ1_METAS|nr:Formyl transferase [Metarhizium album ARSEF 1941]KHN95618.1 Formyl transferase [Metarhizium album ARSEF 1941]